MKEKINVLGMHCKSCEVVLEEDLSRLKGVKKVWASSKKGSVFIEYQDNFSKQEAINLILRNGYKVGKKDLPFINASSADIFEILVSVFAVFIVILFLTRMDIASNILGGFSAANLISVFLIGITAGLSTCMALVGGLVLGISARYSENHSDASTLQKFRPHLFFNLGRILSYFIFGGLIGALGGFFQLSGVTLGFMTLAIGFIMLFLGIKIINIFPRFNYVLTLPKFVSKGLKIGEKSSKEYSHTNSLILGALTFFIPCGFTQAMQVLAIGTGNFFGGALIMSVFAIGTAPGLLGIGGLASSLKDERKNSFFFKLVGVFVIFLALYNIINGFNLTGLRNTFSNEVENNQIISSETIVLKATYDNENVVEPEEFSIKTGQKVRMEIFAKDDGEGCMGSVMIPGLFDRAQYFQKGKTVVMEFQAKKTGEYWITCAMGVPAGKIIITK